MLFCVLGHNFEWYYSFSVIRLIQQYLKESNLIRTLQTLQVTFAFGKLTNTAPNLFTALNERHCRVHLEDMLKKIEAYVTSQPYGDHVYLSLNLSCIYNCYTQLTTYVQWHSSFSKYKKYNNCSYRFSKSSSCNSITIFTSPSLILIGKEIICFPWS
jgi:hypothetical protein